MILEILFVVDMFLWFLSCLPVPQVAPYGWASNWLAFIAVLLLGLFLFSTRSARLITQKEKDDV